MKLIWTLRKRIPLPSAFCTNHAFLVSYNFCSTCEFNNTEQNCYAVSAVSAALHCRVRWFVPAVYYCIILHLQFTLLTVSLYTFYCCAPTLGVQIILMSWHSVHLYCMRTTITSTREIDLMMWSELETCHHKWYLDIENCFLLHSLYQFNLIKYFQVSSKLQNPIFNYFLTKL